MPYTKNEDGTFTVTSRSGSTHKWTVSADMQSCDCPKFKFILRRQSQCHHITEVLTGEQNNQPLNNDYPKFNPDKYTTIMSEDEFITKFGDEQYDHLIKMQEIILHHRTVRLLK
jgi:hypothetical protein